MAKFALFLLSSLGLVACGQLRTGTAIPNDPVPDGIVLKQGSFQSLNAMEASGTVTVYRSNATGEAIIRLEGIVMPDENGLRVVGVTAVDGEAYNAALRSTRGTQNYYTGLGDTVNWTSVFIRSTLANPQVRDYAKAALEAP